MSDTRYINSKQLRARYGGVSDMWIWRRLTDDPSFPRPDVISRRRFWKVKDLDAWDNARREVA